MGRGNFLPTRLEGEIGYEMIYIPIPELDEDQFVAEIEFEDFKDYLEESILDVLPKSYEREQQWKNDRYIVASNGVTDIYLADNQYSLALVVHPRFCDYFPNHRYLAVRHLKSTMKKIINRLKCNGFEIHLRTSAWTTLKI